jgi:hypothetical protein
LVEAEQAAERLVAKHRPSSSCPSACSAPGCPCLPWTLRPCARGTARRGEDCRRKSCRLSAKSDPNPDRTDNLPITLTGVGCTTIMLQGLQSALSSLVNNIGWQVWPSNRAETHHLLPAERACRKSSGRPANGARKPSGRRDADRKVGGRLLEGCPEGRQKGGGRQTRVQEEGSDAFQEHVMPGRSASGGLIVGRDAVRASY